MDFELHFKSITSRWFFQVFMIIAAVVLVVAVAFSVLASSIYFERVKSISEDYAYEFNSLSSANAETFEDTAIKASDEFAHKNKIEVQILNPKGEIIVTTTGFQSDADVKSEFALALSSSKGYYNVKTVTSGGERVMAGTKVISSFEGETLGAYRWVVSLEQTWHQINLVVTIIIIFSIVVLSLCGLSGLFFIKSIVNPIKNVSSTARKIALGDFKSKIEFNKNDEIGELCDTINYMANELHEADTMKNDFISSVSHELRTPLTAIRGWGETAKMSVGSDEELVRRGLDVVLSEADRLSGLVEELLDFSRMQSGRLTVNTMPIDVSELLRSVTDMYTELAVKQGIELSYTPPAENSIVMGDPDRLKQVFINVIDNAVKYTEKGGLVLVVQSREEGCVQILVKDTGVGIPESDLDHVKEKFFKSNKTVRGSGIGLAVADEIIKQHKGLLFLQSTEGVGTTVTIVLPLYEPPEEAPVEQEAEEIQKGEN